LGHSGSQAPQLMHSSVMMKAMGSLLGILRDIISLSGELAKSPAIS
jgi:hypothetical protein